MESFKANLLKGIDYYQKLILKMSEESGKRKVEDQLKDWELKILSIIVPTKVCQK
jgi:hypothetical protein